MSKSKITRNKVAVDFDWLGRLAVLDNRHSPSISKKVGQRPSASAAPKGRTDGSTDQHCMTVRKTLANGEPSTDGYGQTKPATLLSVGFDPESGS